MSYRIVVLPLLLTLTACAHAASQPSAPAATQRVVLAPATPTRVADTSLTLTLLAVTDDSRCPENVTCIWAGDVTVQLRLDEARGATREATLQLNRGEHDVTHAGVRVQLVSVAPHPKAEQPIDPATYRVSLDVSRHP